MAKATKKTATKSTTKTKAKAKTTAKRKVVKRKAKVTKAAAPKITIMLTHDQIAARAYEIWVRKGRRSGDDAANWDAAKQELQASS